jgi:hypothetical protein
MQKKHEINIELRKFLCFKAGINENETVYYMQNF